MTNNETGCLPGGGGAGEEGVGGLVVVEDGRIAEIGTHDELIAADGRYASQLAAGELVLPG